MWGFMGVALASGGGALAAQAAESQQALGGVEDPDARHGAVVQGLGGPGRSAVREPEGPQRAPGRAQHERPLRVGAEAVLQHRRARERPGPFFGALLLLPAHAQPNPPFRRPVPRRRRSPPFCQWSQALGFGCALDSPRCAVCQVTDLRPEAGRE